MKFKEGDIVTPIECCIGHGRIYYISDIDDNVYEKYKLSPVNSTYDDYNIDNRVCRQKWTEDELLYYYDNVEINKNIKNKGENNMNKILEIYREKQTKEIEKKYDSELEDLEFNDPLQTIVREMTKEMNNQIKTIYENEEIEEPIVIDCNLSSQSFTKETIEKRKKIVDKIRAEKQKLNEKISEIQALLELAPNYEEKIKILRDYGIIDKKKNVIL